MADFTTNLTTGGFIATLAALVLAICAYVISRKAQIDAQKQERTSEAPADAHPEEGLEEAPAQAPRSAAEESFDAGANPYRWD